MVRSLLVLVAAGTLFATFLATSHSKARKLTRNRARAVKHLMALASGKADLPVEREGYRFVRAAGLVMARPLRPGEDGVSWMVSRDGKTVWEFDTVLFRAPGGVPDPVPLARYLELTDSKRAKADIPYGWRLVRHNTMVR